MWQIKLVFKDIKKYIWHRCKANLKARKHLRWNLQDFGCINLGYCAALAWQVIDILLGWPISVLFLRRLSIDQAGFPALPQRSLLTSCFVNFWFLLWDKTEKGAGFRVLSSLFLNLRSISDSYLMLANPLPFYMEFHFRFQPWRTISPWFRLPQWQEFMNSDLLQVGH